MGCLVDCLCQKNENFYVPFVVQFGCGRCVFRSFNIVCICNSAEQIVNPGMGSQIHMRMGWTKLGRERAQISRLSRDFSEAFFRLSCSFIYSMATTKEMAMCNDETCTQAWTEECYIINCNVWNFTDTIYLFLIFILFWRVVCRGGP